MGELIKVMIVDDHESMRNSFEHEFCAENGFEVVASIASAKSAELECQSKHPDIVIMDVCTEENASGLDAAGTIREKFPEIKIIMTSGFDEISFAPRAKELGTHAFICKSKSSTYFREAAHRVLKGEYSFPESRTIPIPQGEAHFTAREIEILELKCRHIKNPDIAAKLFISEKTVKRHIENMLKKTDFSSILDLVIYVVSNGWINPNY